MRGVLILIFVAEERPHIPTNLRTSRLIVIAKTPYGDNAGIAQLGEQQTEVLEVACSIHAPGIQVYVDGNVFLRFI